MYGKLLTRSAWFRIESLTACLLDAAINRLQNFGVHLDFVRGGNL